MSSTLVTIYSSSGVVVYEGVATEVYIEIFLPAGRLYIIKYSEQIEKVVL